VLVPSGPATGEPARLCEREARQQPEKGSPFAAQREESAADSDDIGGVVGGRLGVTGQHLVEHWPGALDHGDLPGGESSMNEHEHLETSPDPVDQAVDRE